MIKIFMFPMEKPLIIANANLRPTRIDHEWLIFSIYHGNIYIGDLSVPLDEIKGEEIDFETLRLSKFLGPKAMEVFRNWCSQGRLIMGFIKEKCKECNGAGYIKDHAGIGRCYYCGGKGKRWVPLKETPAS